MKYLQVTVDDAPGEPIRNFFEPCSAFIKEAKDKKSRVLVHCNMGMSRSCTIVLAYLMKHEGLSLAQALVHTKERRPVVSPNPGFMGQLIEYETEMRGRPTIDLGTLHDGPLRRGQLVRHFVLTVPTTVPSVHIFFGRWGDRVRG